jgi:hypothetical protein
MKRTVTSFAVLVMSLFFMGNNVVAGMSDGMAAVRQDMQLLGKGAAYYLKFIKVYDAELYSETIVAPEDILLPGVSKCLHLQYAVGVKKDDFITAANTVLARQFTPEQLNKVANELDILHDGYQDVEKGDSYTLCYADKTETTSLALNDKVVVAVSSPVFAETYFSIWLGETEPLDDKLRKNLLAGTFEK